MAEYTQNYNLEKQQRNDYVSIDGLNGNFDIIDSEIKKVNDSKVDKVEGKGLSANNYTTDEKNKLAGIANNANNYAHPSTHPASMITGLPTSLPANGGNAATVGGLQPWQLGSLNQAGGSHGTQYTLTPKFNVNGDGRFRADIYNGGSVSHGVRVGYADATDSATNANYAGSAGNADTVDGYHVDLNVNSSYGLKPIGANNYDLTPGSTALPTGYIYIMYE